MRRDSPRYGSFPKRRKSRERPWNRASPAFGKLWEHAGKCRVDLAEKNIQILEKNVIIDMDDKNCIMEGIIKVRTKAALRHETEQLTAPDTEDTEEGLVLNELE